MLTHLLSLVNSIYDYITLTGICQVLFLAICRYQLALTAALTIKTCVRILKLTATMVQLKPVEGEERSGAYYANRSAGSAPIRQLRRS